MSIKLTLGDDVYDYPTTGTINYGEEATNWAEKVSTILRQISGPGDIPLTEVDLIGTDTGTEITGNITNLLFDTAFTQSIEVNGFLTRTYVDATPDQVEQFTIKGAYNGTEINFSVDYSGDDTEVEFSVVGGQFKFTYLKITNTETVKIKYSAKAIVDESFFS
jgi:hypothetical protein